MTDLGSSVQDDLLKQRKLKKRQRSLRSLQGVWRSLALMALASGAMWIVTRPEWILYSSDQITIEGNKALSPESVRDLIPLTYPQSLLSLKPERLAEDIEAKGPIAKAIVTRHLLPPSLSIQVQERVPVAKCATPISPMNTRPREAGYLDEEGNWLPASAYQNLNKEITMPTLEVIGVRQLQLPFWKQIYPVLQRSPVKIISINWQDSSNMILNTEIGAFHLGANIKLLETQLVAIAKLKQSLNKAIPTTAIDYIDISDPNQPLIRQTQPVNPKPKEPEPPQT